MLDEIDEQRDWITNLTDDYDYTLLRLAEQVRDKASEEARGPSYRALINLADQLAATLRERGEYHAKRAKSWQEALNRVHRYADG
jgi:hypothetical protein